MLLLLLGNMPMLFGQSLKVDIKGGPFSKSAPSIWALPVARMLLAHILVMIYQKWNLSQNVP